MAEGCTHTRHGILNGQISMLIMRLFGETCTWVSSGGVTYFSGYIMQASSRGHDGPHLVGNTTSRGFY